MQKKLYKHRSMPFNLCEHIKYKVFYSQNGTDREIQVFMMKFREFYLKLFLHHEHFYKQKYHWYVYHKNFEILTFNIKTGMGSKNDTPKKMLR